MTRRDPFTEIEDLIERMGREFEELGGTLDTPGPGVPGYPARRDVAVDVIEGDEEVTVLADLPGFDADEIEVELHDDALSIAATREETRDAEATVGESDPDADDAAGEGDVRYHRRERRRRAVSRRIPIPEPVERDGTTASYDDGVLTVTLPKRSSPDSAGHSIDVN
ncbi:heat-shock protein Hsp20 [Halorubrum saccharovorum]|uniref:Heat-shock protein Hsp20 n=1 Tax=Halorubrum saccharovorum TaxID=2248 RepID=A0A081ESW4_9EURY|nr:Hsp20/alpha crystallin family protein [Halorubrum saccharovorum]KDS90502.1 heat-shock protein Hsp20 [Halorubrum saccharovorum]